MRIGLFPDFVSAKSTSPLALHQQHIQGFYCLLGHRKACSTQHPFLIMHRMMKKWQVSSISDPFLRISIHYYYRLNEFKDIELQKMPNPEYSPPCSREDENSPYTSLQAFETAPSISISSVRSGFSRVHRCRQKVHQL